MYNMILDASAQGAGYGQADLIMGVGMIALFGAIMYFMI